MIKINNIDLTKLLYSKVNLNFEVKDNAPNSFKDLSNESNLVIWSGASDNTIWSESKANWLFRAHHDLIHVKYSLDFTLDGEIEVARIQANNIDNEILAQVFLCEVIDQAEYFKRHGTFPVNQREFMVESLKNRGIILL
jgi:hypothetical protein